MGLRVMRQELWVRYHSSIAMEGIDEKTAEISNCSLIFLGRRVANGLLWWENCLTDTGTFSLPTLGQ